MCWSRTSRRPRASVRICGSYHRSGHLACSAWYPQIKESLCPSTGDICLTTLQFDPPHNGRAPMTVEITYRFTHQPGAIRAVPDNPGDAVQRLNAGNRSFSELVKRASQEHAERFTVEFDPRLLGLEGDARRIVPQEPFAAVLGCADARVPIELVFNEGPNELFVVRVAGNGLGPDVLGSFHYAISHLRKSLRLLVVLGHSGCGALTAAVDVFLDPGGYLEIATNAQLRSIVDRHLIAVQASARVLARAYGGNVVDRPGYRQALVEAAITTNAALAAHTLQAELHGRGLRRLKAMYGVYLLDTHTIWTPEASSGGLGDPPVGLAGFRKFGDILLRSERIASLLATG
jgi:carbonic anhydrase